MKRAIVVVVILFSFVIRLTHAGGGVTILMEMAGKTNKEINYAMSLPLNANITEDLEMILPGKMIFISADGRKSVIFELRDTLFGVVFHDLPEKKR